MYEQVIQAHFGQVGLVQWPIKMTLPRIYLLRLAYPIKFHGILQCTLL